MSYCQENNVPLMSLSDVLMQTAYIELMYRLLSTKVTMCSQKSLQCILGTKKLPAFIHRKERHHDVVLADNIKVKAQLLAGSYKTLVHYLWLAIGHNNQA